MQFSCLNLRAVTNIISMLVSRIACVSKCLPTMLCRWMQAQHAPTAAAAEDMPEPVEQSGSDKVVNVLGSASAVSCTDPLGTLCILQCYMTGCTL